MPILGMIGLVFSFLTFLSFAGQSAGYKDMLEFSKSWERPLSKNEIQLFEIEWSPSKEISSFKFKNDASFRGLFCKKGIVFHSSKVSDPESIVFPVRQPRIPNMYCTYKGKKMYAGKFSKKTSQPTIVEVESSDPKNGDTESIVFEGIEIAQTRLSAEGVGKGKFILRNELNKEITSDFDVDLVEPVVFLGSTIPSGFTISYKDCDVGNGKHQLTVASWDKKINFRGVRCDYLNIRSSQYVTCKLSDDYKFQGSVVPKGSRALFKTMGNKNELNTIQYFSDLTGDVTVNDLQVKKGMEFKVVDGKAVKANFTDLDRHCGDAGDPE